MAEREDLLQELAEYKKKLEKWEKKFGVGELIEVTNIELHPIQDIIGREK